MYNMPSYHADASACICPPPTASQAMFCVWRSQGQTGYITRAHVKKCTASCSSCVTVPLQKEANGVVTPKQAASGAAEASNLRSMSETRKAKFKRLLEQQVPAICLAFAPHTLPCLRFTCAANACSAGSKPRHLSSAYHQTPAMGGGGLDSCKACSTVYSGSINLAQSEGSATMIPPSLSASAYNVELRNLQGIRSASP